jgi:hypothetical protein
VARRTLQGSNHKVTFKKPYLASEVSKKKEKEASKVKGNLETENRKMWNPRNRKTMMEGDLSIKTNKTKRKQRTHTTLENSALGQLV